MKTRTFNLEVTLTEVEIELVNRLFRQDIDLIIDDCGEILSDEDIYTLWDLHIKDIIFYERDEDLCQLTNYGKQIMEQLL